MTAPCYDYKGLPSFEGSPFLYASTDSFNCVNSFNCTLRVFVLYCVYKYSGRLHELNIKTYIAVKAVKR